MITPEQCRAARALLRMSQDDLATKAKISTVTIRKFENGTDKVREATANLIGLTLQAAGVEFIDSNGRGPGVQLKRPVS